MHRQMNIVISYFRCRKPVKSSEGIHPHSIWMCSWVLQRKGIKRMCTWLSHLDSVRTHLVHHYWCCGVYYCHSWLHSSHCGDCYILYNTFQNVSCVWLPNADVIIVSLAANIVKVPRIAELKLPVILWVYSICYTNKVTSSI